MKTLGISAFFPCKVVNFSIHLLTMVRVFIKGGGKYIIFVVHSFYVI